MTQPTPTEAQVAMLSTHLPPFPAPSLFDLAEFVDSQAESLKLLCQQLHVAFEACAQDIDPALDEQEMFDPIAARFLWHHVPDICDIASRASVLGFWLQMLRGVLDFEKVHATAPTQLRALPAPAGMGGREASGQRSGDLVDGEEDDLPAFLTPREAVARLRLSAEAVYSAVRRGDLPAKRVGRSIRIPRSAVGDTPAEPVG